MRFPVNSTALAISFVVVATIAPGSGVSAQTHADSAAGAMGPHREVPPTARAVRLTGPVSLDGRLDEDVWRIAEPATGFRQSQPDEGKDATQRTEVRFAYDHAAIYIGARMFDTEGGKGVRTRLMRRDALSESDSDFLNLVFDSYHDHQSTVFFTINPSGSKRDGAGDATWDPVWEAQTRIDSLGWTAEIRIPFNQLNFSRATDQTWGLQIVRFAHRINERSHFSWWPNNESGGPPRFGHLEGIRITERPRGLELVPFSVARARFVRPADPSNPFTKSNDRDYRIGGDLKYRLTSNLTLNAAFNPDFGQVEVDPAVVNLSAFETFFPERRPFFIENQSSFGFGNFSCFFCGNASNLRMFYSRRIGRSPQLFPSGTYVDQPENTTILAAGKITGRTASNYRVGIMNALTRRMKAAVIHVDPETGARTSSVAEVEPLTNYFVARTSKDFKGGQFRVGGIGTSVDRFTGDDLAEARLARSARGLGLDWFTATKDRQYTFFGQQAFSDVRGSTASIEGLQRSSARYFQRPDRDPGGNSLFSDLLDPDATRLSGYAGYARVAKESGTWNWESMVNYRSPGFETNDISFITRSGYISMHANLARSVSKPGPVFRNYFAVLSAQQQYNYDGDRTDRQFATGIFTQLRNFWEFNVFTIYSPDMLDDGLTRGGPVVKRRGYSYNQMFVGTDARRQVSVSTNPSYLFRSEGSDQYNLNASMTWKPTSSVQLSAGPGFSKSPSLAQFVTSGPDSTATNFYGRRYIFAEIDQRQLSMTTRANIVFSPTLTLEAFAQPLIASGDYKTFREFTNPREATFNDFRPGVELRESIVNGRRIYTVDADGPGNRAQPISFGDPNFNFRSLRGSAVMRWEYRPGSTVFFVWQQNRSDIDPIGDFSFGRDRSALFNARPDNIFLIKASYWLAF